MKLTAAAADRLRKELDECESYKIERESYTTMEDSYAYWRFILPYGDHWQWLAMAIEMELSSVHLQRAAAGETYNPQYTGGAIC